MEKQRTLYQQARLHDRGAAEMVLQMISASKGNVLQFSSEHIIMYNAMHIHMHNDVTHYHMQLFMSSLICT